MKRIIFNFCFVWLAVSAFAGSKVVEMRNYGLVPDTHENLSPKLQKALQDHNFRSEEHTSELQSHHDISYAVFCLKKKKKKKKKKKNNKKKKKKKKYFFFFFNDTATTEIYTCRHTLSLHDALPI